MLRLVVNKQFMTEQEENQAIADLRAKGWEVTVNDDYIDWDDYSERTPADCPCESCSVEDDEHYDEYGEDDKFEYGGYEM